MRFRQHLSETIRLATPVALFHVSDMITVLVDTVMVGHLGRTELAAATFANAVTIVPFLFSVGFSIAITPLAGAFWAAGNTDDARRMVRVGAWSSMGLSVLVTVALLALIPFLHLFGSPQNVVQTSIPFYIWFVLSFIPRTGFGVFKQTAEAMANTRIAMIIALSSNALNIVLNWIFIYGYVGVPAFGVEGAGIGTFIARSAGFIAAWLVFAKSDFFVDMRKTVHSSIATRVSVMKDFIAICKTGIPIGGQVVVEITAFAMGALMIGNFGEVPLSSHQIAINLAAVTFMVALGIGSASTIRVSHLRGQNNMHEAFRAARAALLLVFVFECITAILFITLRDVLPRMYTFDIEVITLASTLLIYAAAFQLFDGLQAVGLAVLRGYNDVKIPALIAIVAYLVVSLPVSAYCAFTLHWGAAGVWVGYLAGLIVASVGFLWRVLRVHAVRGVVPCIVFCMCAYSMQAEVLINTHSKATIPDRLCPGAVFSISGLSTVADSIEIEVILNPLSIPPFFRTYVGASDSQATVPNLVAPDVRGALTIWIIIRDVRQLSQFPPDTNKGVILVVDCCANAVMNGAFSRVTTGGSCFPVDYQTDLDFGNEPLGGAGCRPSFDAPGQIASESSARFKSPAFEGFSHTPVTGGDFFLFGDPIANVKERAWIQNQPVYGGRAYHAVAWVRNVEKIIRTPGPITNLRMMLVARQNGVADTIDREEFLQYDANPTVAWKELSGVYTPPSDGEVELAVVVESITSGGIGYGFGIDDISFIPTLAGLDAGSDVNICKGASAQLNPQIPAGATFFWRNAAGITDTLSMNPIVKPSDTTTYTLVIVNAYACVDSATVTVNVIEADSIVISTVDSVLCALESTVLRGPKGATSYQWRLNNVNIGNATSDTLFVTQPGLYTLTSASPFGCTLFSNTIQVYFQAPSVITAMLDTTLAAYPLRIGTVVDIPVIVRRNVPVGTPLPLETVTVHVSAPASVLVPQDEYRHSPITTARVVVATTQPFTNIDTVHIRWLVCLGLEDTAQMQVRIEQSTDQCASFASWVSYALPVEICRADGDRLVYAGEPLRVVAVSPQPADDEVNVDIYALEIGRTTLDVVSPTGTQLHSTFTDIDMSGFYRLIVPTNNLSSGTYLLIVRGPNTIARSIMRVVR
ncbi:MAG: MATE family efflux transporter [bacterium]|nr:MATE family efflux transporter [bacterium]